MHLKDLKDRFNDAVETENPPGTDYYGAEMDEGEVKAAKERMEKATGAVDETAQDDNPTLPVAQRQGT